MTTVTVKNGLHTFSIDGTYLDIIAAYPNISNKHVVVYKISSSSSHKCVIEIWEWGFSRQTTVNVNCTVYYLQSDASLKTDTCKVPDKSSFFATIYSRYVIQALPITYPSGNKDAINYIVTLIGPSGISVNDILQITGSIIWMSKDGTLLSASIYKNSNNPITCKYWYIDVQ